MPKQDLSFATPLMNGPGTLGFAPDLRAPVDWPSLGAFVTNPISLRARLPAADADCVEYAGGLLLHSGLPNPGFRRVLTAHSGAWRQSALPIIVHLMADRPEETRQMVRALEGLDNVVAVELGFAPLLADDIILLALGMSVGELPIIARLPDDQFLRLGPRCVEQGAAAISMAAPEGAISVRGHWLTGRLLGAALLPRSLRFIREASRLGLPVIASGGTRTPADADLMLNAGALAVQVDLPLWLPGSKSKSPVQ